MRTAMAALSRVYRSAALFLLLCCYAPAPALGEDTVFRVASLPDSTAVHVCSPSAGPGRSHLKVVHRHGACAAPAADGAKLNHAQRLAGDALRVASFQRNIRRARARASREKDPAFRESQATLPVQAGAVVGSGDYVVTVGFGTPKADQIVILDTGSVVCWIQCQPCRDACYSQRDPVFDPSASSSYHNISCSSDECAIVIDGDGGGCSGDTCVYTVNYVDGSSTVGFVATEQLTLSSDGIVLRPFLFGCGQDNKGLFGGVAGLLGLARGPVSLVTQASRNLGNAFSYCLPTIGSTGYFTIGGGGGGAHPAVYTDMVSDSRSPTLYFIRLTGISVGGKRLPLDPAVFASGGTIIDSGTVISRLPPSAYGALKSAFIAAMTRYQRAEPFGILDACFDFTGVPEVSYPPITLHFDGADLTLDLLAILAPVDDSISCLAFAGNQDPSDVGIVGNLQQQGTEVIYDLAAQKIGFAAGACR